MDKSIIESIIKKALTEDQRELVKKISLGLGITDKTELGHAVIYVLGFVSIVPNLLEAVATSNLGRNISIASSPFMKAIENYFLDQDEIIPEAEFPDVLGLLDDTYYTIRLLQIVKQNFPENRILPELNLNYARNVFIDIIGMNVAKRIEKRVFEDIEHLMLQKQKELINNISSIGTPNKDVNIYNAIPKSYEEEFGLADSVKPPPWHDFESSGYKPQDPFNDDSAGWPGGAYQNPDSGYYSPEEDY